MKASKYFTRRSSGRVLFVNRILYLLHAAEASCFLRLMSRSVSNFEPRSIVSFQFSSPLWLIENFSVLSVYVLEKIVGILVFCLIFTKIPTIF